MKRILLIIFLLLHFNVMADDTLIEDFINQINEVKQEYKKDSLEYKIPTSFFWVAYGVEQQPKSILHGSFWVVRSFCLFRNRFFDLIGRGSRSGAV